MEYLSDLKLALCSPVIKLGDVSYNTALVIKAIDMADSLGADFLCLPPDVLSGSIGSLYDHPVMLKAVEQAVNALLRKTESVNIALILKIGAHELKIKGGRIEKELPDAPIMLPYELLPNGASATSDIRLRNALREFSKSTPGKIVCAVTPNIGESTGERVYDGQRTAARDGRILADSGPFNDEMLIVPYNAKPSAAFGLEPEKEPVFTYLSDDPCRRAIECERLLDLQAHALKRRAEHIGSKGFVIGVSGGLDSALALIAAVLASRLMGLDPKASVLGVSMPGFGTTPRTRANAEKLITALGAEFSEIDIRPACLLHFKSLGMSENIDGYTSPELLVLENAQARERTKVLLSISNRDGLLDVGTGDLSEDALGFSTVGGDHLALYGINSSLPKTVIRYMVAFYADKTPDAHDVLYDILETPVSPELLPSKDGREPCQRTEEILGAYALHDLFLLNMLKDQLTPSELYKLALDRLDFSEKTVYETLGLFLKRFFSQQFKRNSCTEAPNILFGISPNDFKMPSDMIASEFMSEYESIWRMQDK